MKMGLEGRRVLVMAGSQGIGLACAQAFHGEGAQVTIAARGAEGLAAAEASMRGCRVVRGDVAEPTDIARIVAAAGAVDVLINNAGGPRGGDIVALDDADWLAAVQLTLMSAVRATRAVLPHMQAQRWGRIVMISSLGVKQPVPGLSLSNSLRMAVAGWAKALANEVGPDNITVNSVLPGLTRTARGESIIAARAQASQLSPEQFNTAILEDIPLRRIGDPHEIANCALFLGSEAASFVTGATLQVDGGQIGYPL